MTFHDGEKKKKPPHHRLEEKMLNRTEDKRERHADEKVTFSRPRENSTGIILQPADRRETPYSAPQISNGPAHVSEAVGAARMEIEKKNGFRSFYSRLAPVFVVCCYTRDVRRTTTTSGRVRVGRHTAMRRRSCRGVIIVI